MKLAYLDCAAGIAGDMCLGALLDCGVPVEYLQHQLSSLAIEDEFELRVTEATQQGLRAVRAVVTTSKADHPHRHLQDIENAIAASTLPDTVKRTSRAVFQTLGKAEATVHGVPLERIHFHEVGAIDAIVDVVGTCLGLDWLGVEEVICSPHPTGGGWVKAAHGKMPVPVPAVAQLWATRNVPVFDNGVRAEVVTPTGAAIAVSLATSFGPPPAMRVETVGLGAGTKDFEIPNVLRIWLGESATASASDVVMVLETQIDDLNPQITARVRDGLLEAGALDAFTQPATMKHGRPGVLITTICPPALAERCEDILFTETTTLGIRRSLQQRSILEREFETAATAYGPITMKIARRNGRIVNSQPEFRDCVAVARHHHLPVREVWLAAQAAWASDRDATNESN
ncbi:MAG: nickel pincer cofactor biosynthesis protein LarC [Cyanobacteria bacterium P01_F01_bin.33]